MDKQTKINIIRNTIKASLQDAVRRGANYGQWSYRIGSCPADLECRDLLDENMKIIMELFKDTDTNNWNECEKYIPRVFAKPGDPYY